MGFIALLTCLAYFVLALQAAASNLALDPSEPRLARRVYRTLPPADRMSYPTSLELLEREGAPHKREKEYYEKLLAGLKTHRHYQKATPDEQAKHANYYKAKIKAAAERVKNFNQHYRKEVDNAHAQAKANRQAGQNAAGGRTAESSRSEGRALTPESTVLLSDRVKRKGGMEKPNNHSKSEEKLNHHSKSEETPSDRLKSEEKTSEHSGSENKQSGLSKSEEKPSTPESMVALAGPGKKQQKNPTKAGSESIHTPFETASKLGDPGEEGGAAASKKPRKVSTGDREGGAGLQLGAGAQGEGGGAGGSKRRKKGKSGERVGGNDRQLEAGAQPPLQHETITEGRSSPVGRAEGGAERAGSTHNEEPTAFSRAQSESPPTDRPLTVEERQQQQRRILSEMKLVRKKERQQKEMTWDEIWRRHGGS